MIGLTKIALISLVLFCKSTYKASGIEFTFSEIFCYLFNKSFIVMFDLRSETSL